jgi:hypothetical protein
MICTLRLLSDDPLPSVPVHTKYRSLNRARRLKVALPIPIPSTVFRKEWNGVGWKTVGHLKRAEVCKSQLVLVPFVIPYVFAVGAADVIDEFGRGDMQQGHMTSWSLILSCKYRFCNVKMNE